MRKIARLTLVLFTLLYYFNQTSFWSFIPEPAKPGALKGTVYAGPNGTLTFAQSDGRVDFYSVNILNYGTVNTSNSLSEVMFFGLIPGRYYNVSIVAFSGGIESEMQVGYFRVAVARKYTYQNEVKCILLSYS